MSYSSAAFEAWPSVQETCANSELHLLSIQGLGTHCTCFTSTKVQTLTAEGLQRAEHVRQQRSSTSSPVSSGTLVLVKQVKRNTWTRRRRRRRRLRAPCPAAAALHMQRSEATQRRNEVRQYVCFCTSKASNLSTCSRCSAAEQRV